MKLSICIPTRNRQKYAVSAIEAILKTPNKNFELVVSDNSDDPVLLKRMLGERSLLNYSNLNFIDSDSQPLSMMANWNRAYEATSGDWVCFIGDDDFVDPNVINIIAKVMVQSKELDYFRWNRLTWNWPDNRLQQTTIRLGLGSDLKIIEIEKVKAKVKEYEGSGDGFTIYHACVKKEVLETLKNSHASKQLFIHPTLDYYIGWELTNYVKFGISSERTFSIAGASAKSNSAAVRSIHYAKRRKLEWIEDSESKINTSGFESILLHGIIYLAWRDYAKNHNIEITADILDKCVASLIKDIKAFLTEHEQLMAIEAAKLFVEKHLTKAELSKLPLTPEVLKINKGTMYTGPLEDKLYLPDSYGDATSAADLYSKINILMTPWAYVGNNKKNIKIL